MVSLSEKTYRYYMLAYSPERTFAYTQEDERSDNRPINSVTPIELDSEVYNFSVDEDNSYVSDFILHNCEGYLVPSLEEKTGRYEYNHLLLLAKNQVGYHNLLKLTTIAHTRGYQARPRVDKKILAEHAEGLIVTSSCLSGEIPELLLRGDLNGARAAARWYQDVFGRENFFIEIQDHDAPESPQVKLNPMLYELGARDGRAAAGHQRPALRRRQRRRRARHPALRADRQDAGRPQAHEVRQPAVLPEDARRDGAALP